MIGHLILSAAIAGVAAYVAALGNGIWGAILAYPLVGNVVFFLLTYADTRKDRIKRHRVLAAPRVAFEQ